MHTATGLPFPLFSLSFQASWPISSKFFVLYSSKLVLYMIEGGTFMSEDITSILGLHVVSVVLMGFCYYYVHGRTLKVNAVK